MIMLLPKRKNSKDVTYEVNENGCWICTSHYRDKDGYIESTRVINEITYRKLHRAVFAYYHGELSYGYYVLHKCDNPSCINPEHLRAGTHDENMTDRKERNRYIGELSRSNLNNTIVLEIDLLLRESQLTMKEIANQYVTSLGTVADIKKGRRWSHITGRENTTISKEMAK
jgi:hypothetical protein